MTQTRHIPNGRRPLYTFLALVTVFAAIGYVVAFTIGDENLSGGLFLVQFAPLVAAFITKFVFKRNLRGLGWGWGKTRYQVAVYCLGFLLPLVSFLLVWSFGFGGFFDTEFIAEVQAELAERFDFNTTSPYAIMLILLLLNGSIGLLIAFGAIGEELGWRGFLVPELYKHFDFTKTALISGTIWAVYHFPLLMILMPERLGASPWPFLAFALVGGIGLSTIAAWFRLKSGSVWTAVIFHMALNIHNQGYFQDLTFETSWLTNYVSGEHGLMAAIVSAAAGYWFWRMRDQLPPRPN